MPLVWDRVNFLSSSYVWIEYENNVDNSLI